MGVFTRFKDIVSSNINSMLDKAEDPEKMIRLMIHEMEETLVELKAGCASLMADRKRNEREGVEAGDKAGLWAGRAELAVEKGREDLAREALMEKRRWQDKLDALEMEQARFGELVEQAQADIAQLEEKLQAAREKQRLLLQRHARAQGKHRAQSDIRRAASSEAMQRFASFERRIERMEAEAELVNPPRRGHPGGLEGEFSLLEHDDAIEAELQSLKEKAGKESGAAGKDNEAVS